jgi:uncharacterized protein HemX
VLCCQRCSHVECSAGVSVQGRDTERTWKYMEAQRLVNVAHWVLASSQEVMVAIPLRQEANLDCLLSCQGETREYHAK